LAKGKKRFRLGRCKFEIKKGDKMKKEIVRRLAKNLSAGNQDLGLLLEWAARTEEPVLKKLWNYQKDVAEEIIILRVNVKCGTDFKRCDLLGCDEFFSTVPWGTRELLKEKADILRERAKGLSKEN
jgi:hypothetical protein